MPRGRNLAKPVEAELVDGNVSVADGELATIIVSGEVEDVSAAVPLTAIRTNANGQEYVIARKTDGDKTEREVTVVVDHTGGGYAAISESSVELTTKYEVKVS